MPETNGALHIAASRNDTLELARLLKDRRCVDEIFRGHTPLHSATKEHCIEALEMLLRLGSNTEIRDPNTGETPLYLSTRMGYMECASLLIQYGANVDSPTDGSTALHLSVLENKIPMVALLLWAGADISRRNGQRFASLHLAIIQGLSDMVYLLLAEGADINQAPPTNFGSSCHNLAVVCGHGDIVQILKNWKLTH
jgi:ankyrin repeat protein